MVFDLQKTTSAVHGGCRLGDRPLLPAHGPLANGATTLMYEGYDVSCERPDVGHRAPRVTILYTAPTLIRNLMKFGTRPLEVMTSRACGSCQRRGQADQRQGVVWLRERRREPLRVVDTWWQTRRGDHDHPSAKPRPGPAAARPIPGIFPGLYDERQRDRGELRLVISARGQACSGRCIGTRAHRETYFERFGPEIYFVGGRGKRDGEGYTTITGRVDDVMNVRPPGLLMQRSRVR